MSAPTPELDFAHVTFISAGAGSGKTYRLTEELETALVDGGVNPAAVIGTTFTVKAAAELKERVRERLIASGRLQRAEQMAQALIGTVHSVCERLLKRFSFELGLSPALNVMSLQDGQRFFNQALDEVLDLTRVRAMNALALRLDQDNWQKAVKAVADKARENDLTTVDLESMGTEGADVLLAFFPESVRTQKAGDLLAELQQAVADALANIDLTIDTTKGTREYVDTLRESQHQLRRDTCPWKVWIDLSTAKATRKSEPLAATVREAAANYESHPDFQADVKRYIEGVVEIAGLAIERFQALKSERGLIDFLDMEQLMLRALDDATVQSRLADELELLLVDEFQDTNPMQLALFVKLAQLAERVFFVGDVKQAIYAFRGCDPDLVFSTLEGMATARAETDILPSSWRSRPALVHYINEVFANAFDGEIPRAAVTLKPEREERTDEPAVMRWSLAGSKKEQRVEALAEGVADLVANGFQIVDPDTNQLRPVRWGDIAVLARTNANVELIARTLKNQRVPMKMTLKGLLATAEVSLARACLRRLNDVTDTLATAEIISLADAAEPEAWLADRLRFLSSLPSVGAASVGAVFDRELPDPSTLASPVGAAFVGAVSDRELSNQRPHHWAEDTHPIIARLSELRADSALRSPVEIVAHVLNDVGTRGIVTGWGPDAIKAGQRQRNLDAFLNLAVEYENHCASQSEAATLTGFLFWLENPSSPELDLQPVVTTGDAVHVLTYHRAKGLEWLVVIATDFDVNDRASLWDVRVNLTAGFDVRQPLANRTIRFWPNLFGRRTKDIPVLDRIAASAEGAECARKSAAEQRRLAYVGMTRARDLLVVGLPEKNLGASAWYQAFASDFALPTDDVLSLPNGHQIPACVAHFDGTGATPQPRAFAPMWFAQRERPSNALRESLSPSSAGPVDGATIGRVVQLGERIALHGDDVTAIGSGLHAIIAAELVNPDCPDAVERARLLLQSHGVDVFLSAEDAVEAAIRFRRSLIAEFSPQKIFVEYPVAGLRPDGRLVKGWADVVLKTAEGFVIIDHKASPKDHVARMTDAIEYSGQLRAYADGLSHIGNGVAGHWIHFPVAGEMFEVCLPS